MVHFPTKQAAEKAIVVLRKLNWNCVQRITLLPENLLKYLKQSFNPEHNLYITNIRNVDHRQFLEVITEILGHPLVDNQIIKGIVTFFGSVMP